MDVHPINMRPQIDDEVLTRLRSWYAKWMGLDSTDIQGRGWYEPGHTVNEMVDQLLKEVGF